ncbi:MAG: o-succinylbenzoate--CoA ligase [bacterium]
MDLVLQRYFLEEALECFGEQPLIVTSDCRLTYHRIHQYVSETIRRLEKQDIEEGDRVAILSPNNLAYVILLLAFWRMGVIAVPMSTRWPQKQIIENLQAIEAIGIITSKGPAPFQKLPEIRHLFLEDLIPLHYNPSYEGNLESGEPWQDRDATIIFTSGSSGTPKAVLHTLGNHLFSALGSNRNIRVGPGDRWLLSLPLYHVGGLAIIFRVILGGGALAIPIPGFPLEENIGELQVTHVSMVSTQFYRLLRDFGNNADLSKLKAVLIGGSAIPDHIIREGVKRGLPVFKSYGSTELASQVTTTHPNDAIEKRFTSGTLLDYRDLQIAEGGEILLKGRTLFRGYVQDRGVVKAVDKKGWFHTGDIGCLDESGYLHVTGRKDNMFISGGENIQPEEIEENLARIEGIKEAIVVPVKHEEFGFRPVAFLKMTSGHRLQFKRIQEWLEDKLPRFKIPAHFFPWPKEWDHSSLKPDRKALKEIAEELVRKEPGRK